MTWEPMHEVLAKALVSEAHGAAPNEMCGFVMLDPHWTYIPVNNCHPRPQQHFQMEADGMLEVLRYNSHQVAGIYHSHPRGRKEPSPDDVEIMRLYRQFRFWIVTYNNVYEWSLDNDVARPVRRDGTLGRDLAYPVLAAATSV
jgi:proteasome lid subunit RPN8/RPN11